MLTVTPAAAEAVRALVAAAPIDHDSGAIRISPGTRTPDGTSLQLVLVDAPETADEEVHVGGSHVFLERQVADFLDDKVLDASFEPGGEVRFSVLDRAKFAPSRNGGRCA